MASEGSFWGIEVKPGKPERLESPEGAFQIHLSQVKSERGYGWILSVNWPAMDREWATFPT